MNLATKLLFLLRNEGINIYFGSAHEGISSYSAQEGINSKGNIIVVVVSTYMYVYIYIYTYLKNTNIDFLSSCSPQAARIQSSILVSAPAVAHIYIYIYMYILTRY